MFFRGGILLLTAAAIAVAVRKITVPLFDETRYIGFAIYNLAIISAICIGLLAGLTNAPISEFWIRTISLIAAPLIVILSLLLPKFYHIHKQSVHFDAHQPEKTEANSTTKSNEELAELISAQAAEIVHLTQLIDQLRARTVNS